LLTDWEDLRREVTKIMRARERCCKIQETGTNEEVHHEEAPK